MGKNFSREKKIDAFALNINHLEKLCSRLRKEFGDDDVSTSITFNGNYIHKSTRIVGKPYGARFPWLLTSAGIMV